MSQAELFRVLASIALLLTTAHLVGRLFQRLRQPVVVGEILGGLLLGPTVLGQLAPDAQEWLFPESGPVASGLWLIYNIGMLLLMYTAGMEMRSVFSRQDGRPVGLVALTGVVAPFLVGLLLVEAVDVDSLLGPAGDTRALTLVVACAIAVTSIPVISRIMLDLGIMRGQFARIVLSVAVLEDVLLNVVLSVALGMAASSEGEEFGVASWLGVESANASAAYHAVASVGFFLVMLLIAALLRRYAAQRGPRAPAAPSSGIAVHITVVLAVSACCVLLGVATIFGAFVVGLLVGMNHRTGGAGPPPLHIQRFASGFFIPVYFAVVGLELDLVHDFGLWFTVLFIAVACLAKASSVYAGARLSGQSKLASRDLAVALNARGGPGIVLAMASYEAGIVSDALFTTLVLTAIVTSQLAGWWLGRRVRAGAFEADLAPARDDDGEAGPAGPAGPRRAHSGHGQGAGGHE